MKWATKPMKGSERGLTDFLQWKEEDKEVVLGLTGVGEEEEAETPCFRLYAAPNWAQTKRLSQSCKNHKVRGSDGEQTERKKEEEGEGFRWLTQAPEISSTRREERGRDGPLRASMPPQTELWSRREAERRIQRKRGQKWRPIAAEVFSKK